MANETFDFKAWILKHSNDEYRMTLENDQLIMLRTDYGEASIQFTEIEENTIVEFKITFDKDHSVKFYLHFELNDENHAKQLYDEMVETLIGLKDQKTLKVLLSCSAGLTTSMFAENLNSVAEMLGLDYHFDAVSYLSLYEEVQNYDIVFIAPQIGYMYNRLKESLPDKLVLQIPTSLFASYDALGAIQFIQQEFKNIEKQQEEKAAECCVCCTQYEKRILSIAIMINGEQTRISYRLYDKCEIIDSHVIMKPSMNIYDLYDIIDTVLLKHSYIDVIGIATPGIVEDDKVFKEPNDGKIIDMKNDFEEKYNIQIFVYNNADAAAVGFVLEHPEYQNVIYHSQPFGFGVGGQSLTVIGPEAVALYAPMTPDMNEVKNKLKSFISEEFLPEFYYIKEPISYMLSGITELCVDYLEKE